MRFPPRWDPYFAEHMSLAEVYHDATVHFDHHRANSPSATSRPSADYIR
jgi:hypothetical protein